MKRIPIFLIAVSAAYGQVAAQQVGRAPLAIEVLTPPTSLFALGRVQLVYEVRLLNYGAQALTLTKLETLSPDGAPLGSWQGAALAQRVGTVGAGPTRTAENLLEVLSIASGATRVAYMYIALPTASDAPLTIQHRVITATSTATDTILGPVVALGKSSTSVLKAPFTDGNWVALRGPSSSSGHRLSIVTLGGSASIPQRYAVDWARLGENGKLFEGDSSALQGWFAYGVPVLAVAAGRVVAARDGESEHAPFGYSAPALIDAREALGNHVIVDLGGGAYATYAHLKPGSGRVKVGDEVTAGQVVGAIGNSGNSLAPHLHFHISSKPGPLEGEGLPFVQESFELLGRVNSSASLLGGMPWVANPAQPARLVNRETPLENMVVRFRK